VDDSDPRGGVAEAEVGPLVIVQVPCDDRPELRGDTAEQFQSQADNGPHDHGQLPNETGDAIAGDIARLRDASGGGLADPGERGGGLADQGERGGGLGDQGGIGLGDRGGRGINRGGAVVLGAVVLGAVVLGAVVLGAVVLGAVVLGVRGSGPCGLGGGGHDFPLLVSRAVFAAAGSEKGPRPVDGHAGRSIPRDGCAGAGGPGPPVDGGGFL